MKATMVMAAAFAAAISVQGEVELSAAADRVESPLRVDMKCVGTLAPRSVKDVEPPRGMKIFLLMGQSNMAGRAKPLDADCIPPQVRQARLGRTNN